jgi:hypothetical protein
VAHPQEGFRAVRRTVRERRADSSSHQAPIEDDHVPILAPAPPQGTGDERLKYELEKKRKYPPAEEFVRHPVDTLKTLARDQGGDDFAENVAKSEVSHGADVRLLRQVDEIENAADDAKPTEVEKLRQLKHARQDAFVRWTIDRHVRCAKQLRYAESKAQPPKSRIALKEWIAYTRQVECPAPYFGLADWSSSFKKSSMLMRNVTAKKLTRSRNLTRAYLHPAPKESSWYLLHFKAL